MQRRMKEGRRGGPYFGCRYGVHVPGRGPEAVWVPRVDSDVQWNLLGIFFPARNSVLFIPLNLSQALHFHIPAVCKD